ncbi:MAG TPA: hypothetical protein DCY14_17255, partial [Anaerolineae bacterium]|nr:hypothetical protein [Anaerolineae bacterium]
MNRLGLRLGLIAAILLASSLMASCRSPQIGEEINITITADGVTREFNVPTGSTVSQALQTAGILPGSLDKTEPPFYTLLSDGDTIILTRVAEEFSTEEV